MKIVKSITRKIIKGQIYFYLFLHVNTQLFGQTGKEVINSYLETVSNGDPSKWLLIKSAYATSVGYFDVASFQSSVNLMNTNPPIYKKMWKVWPDHQREELYSDSLFADITSLFYFLPNKHVILIKGMPVIESKPKKNVWFEFYPIRIQQYVKESTEIELNDWKVIPGKTYELLEVRIKTKTDEHFLLFNPSTYLLEAIYFPQTDIYWVLSDYKEFDGYLIPGTVKEFKSRLLYSTLTYTSFSINIDIDPKLFVPAK